MQKLKTKKAIRKRFKLVGHKIKCKIASIRHRLTSKSQKYHQNGGTYMSVKPVDLKRISKYVYNFIN